VIVDGRPNQFRRRCPASAFAPKSSGVARYFLMHPGEAVIQREIARATGGSEGFVSRIVSRLEDEHYVRRDEDGALRVKDPRLLLEAWREQYRFSKHTIIEGHVAARSGDALAHLVGDALKARGLEHAATGLAAAWQLTRFATFRIATGYAACIPSRPTSI
jgi:DNA-binding MarR family transcriptional regulator